MEPFAPSARVENTTPFDFAPFISRDGNKGVSALLNALGLLSFSAAGFATKSGLFQDCCADAIVFGPGSRAQADQPNEFIKEKELTSFVDSMRRVPLSSSALG